MVRVLSVAICFAMAIITAQAQIPRLEIQYPKPGQDAVSTSTSIVVRAPLEIDARSITMKYPNSEVSGWKRKEPTVLVLRDSLAQSVDRSRWYSHAITGTYTIEEGRTLRWRPRNLLPNKRYRCVVSEVALDASRGGNVCAPLEWTFTTAPDVPRVLRTTLDSESVISCGRPIHVGFTDPFLVQQFYRGYSNSRYRAVPMFGVPLRLRWFYHRTVCLQRCYRMARGQLVRSCV